MSLKARIQEAMLHAGLNPSSLAEATGTTRGAVSSWLHGRTKSLKADSARRIELATGYSSDWIVTGKGEKLSGAAQVAKLAPGELSASAIELGALYDLLPLTDRIRRAQAFAAASAAILAVLQRAGDDAGSADKT